MSILFHVLLIVSSTLALQSLTHNKRIFLNHRRQSSSHGHHASIAASDSPTPCLADNNTPESVFLSQFESNKQAGWEYADMMGLGNAEAALYALFQALASTRQLGLKGTPMYLENDTLEQYWGGSTSWPHLFTLQQLEQAVDDDFLDAARGSTDNRKGWQITDVSVPRGDSFHDARMTFEDVQSALTQGTVILNAAGAHVPRLAGPTLACTDATLLPCALNLYVTAPHQRTSAPPHTDAQDVVVVQTAGRKLWRVFAPVWDKPQADVFARGKGQDNLPFYGLKEKGNLLLETTLSPGDVLFVPAGFPHTTSTVVDDTEETSVHLTLGIDHHIWELDFVSARRLALQRKGIPDILDYPRGANELPEDIRADLLAELPLGFTEGGEAMADEVASILQKLHVKIDAKSDLSFDDCKDAVSRLQQQGKELLETHRDMYVAAIDEGRQREAEESMRSHLGNQKREMTPERVQRLSLFRVKRFYDRINESKENLKQWSESGSASSGDSKIDANWAFTMPVKVGDQVEADLGGAFFAAKVTRASGGTYDVAFFDGDREAGLSREQIKLLTPPKAAPVASDTDTSKMTAKQLKRWKKQQEKLKKRQRG